MGKLTYSNHRYTFVAKDAREAQLARRLALKVTADPLRWVTLSPMKARGLRAFADATAERKLKKAFITELEGPESILYPDHLEPRLFQVESAWHCLTRTPAYCADEQGLGKTITACLCMRSVPGRALVVCPPYLKYNWLDEIEKWVEPGCAEIIETGKDDEQKFKSPVVILPDSLLTNTRIRAILSGEQFTWLFVDEAHRYKEATTQRTQSLAGREEDEDWYAIAESAKRVVFLSGTPIPNGKPIELWPLLSQLAHEALGHRSKEDFGKVFCGGKKVTRFEGKRAIAHWDFSGATNLKQLRRELRQSLMVRHLKRDHLKELGPKTRNIIFLDEVKKLHQLEKQVLRDFTLDELMGADHELGDIARYRREVGEAKLLPSFTLINEWLENSPDKLVVFAHHIDVVEGLHRMLCDAHGALMIRGGMTAYTKAEKAKLFQTRSEHRVMVGNMDAMGVGLTLTAAPGVVVVEPSWVPGINEQAEDRVHRMTQAADNVYVRYLVLRNSLDERMLRRVLDKQKAITCVMD